jgi:hypothetical protein
MARPRAYLLVGIDFGTTCVPHYIPLLRLSLLNFRYSGVAWAWSERPESHHVVVTWDGTEGQRTSAKVPSTILYKGDEIQWGFNIPPNEAPLRWFKLLLLREADIDPEVRDSAYMKEARDMLAKAKKSAETVVADYIGMLWKYTLKEMATALGESALESQPLRVVITVPAIWPQYAQTRMQTAAHSAGILDQRHAGKTEFHLCPEPEAGALAVMEDYDGHPVQVSHIIPAVFRLELTRFRAEIVLLSVTLVGVQRYVTSPT